MFDSRFHGRIGSIFDMWGETRNIITVFVIFFFLSDVRRVYATDVRGWWRITMERGSARTRKAQGAVAIGEVAKRTGETDGRQGRSLTQDAVSSAPISVGTGLTRLPGILVVAHIAGTGPRFC